MLKSKYTIGSEDNIAENLKKKLLFKKPDETSALTTDEIASEINGNRPAYTKEEVEKINKSQENKDFAITGGNYSLAGKEAPISKNIIEEDVDKKSNWGEGNIADKSLSASGGILDMASTVLSKNGPMNKNERTANTMNLTAKGAQTGMAFGPYGAAVGAAIGLGTGLIMGSGDQKKIDAKEKMDRIAYLENIKDKRKKAQMLSDGENSLDKSKSLIKAQMGILGSKYLPTKEN